MIQQIADRAGISTASVKHILGGRGDRYAVATRARVEEAAGALGYRANASAIAVATGRFRTLAMVTSDSRDRSVWAGSLWEGLQRHLARHDYHLTVHTLADDGLAATAPPKILREHLADGLILNYVYRVPTGLDDALARHRIPAVWINRALPWDAVLPDDVDAGRKMTEALLRAGHRRIAYWSSHATPHSSDTERQEGYRAAMAAAGLAAQVVVGGEAEDRRGWLVRVRELLQRPDRPTALVTYGPYTAYPVLLVAGALGLAVPEDLSIATVHELPACETGIPLSTWIIPYAEMGDAAAEMGLLAVTDRSPQRTRRIPCMLTTGDSIAPPRNH